MSEVFDVTTLLHKYRETCEGFGKTVYWFRGHARADWTLVPSVYRKYDFRGERNLVHRFRLGAPTRHERCPPRSDLAGWLSLMQHYGLPTRLLDWTASLLTAAYFAVSYERHEGPAAIWILVPSELNRSSRHAQAVIFQLDGSEPRSLVEAPFTGHGSCCEEEILAVVASELDLRMTVQQGAFTIHGSAKPLEKVPNASRFLSQFVIPAEAKKTLEEELWALGLRRSSLFPDLANLAADLRNDKRLVPWRGEGREEVT